MAIPSNFPEAYARFLPPIRAKCRRMLGRAAIADEIAQETFARLWQSGPRLDGTADTRTIMAWLYVTSTRLATDVLREGRVMFIDEAEIDLIAHGSSPAAVAAARSSIAALCRAVPADELEAAVLTRIDGLSQPEVAVLLGVSERTLRRRLDRFDERSAHLREDVVR